MSDIETLHLDVSKEEKRLLEHYAISHQISITELVMRAVMDKIEGELDLGGYTAKLEEEAPDDPARTAQLADEVGRMLDI